MTDTPDPDPTPDEAERPVRRRHKQVYVEPGVAAELQDWSDNR